MAARGKATDGSWSMTRGPASLTKRDLQTPSHQVGPSTPNRDDTPDASRRSPTFRRTANNARNFAHNRHSHEAAVFDSYRVRTRSVARIEVLESQGHTQHTEHADSGPGVVQANGSDKAVKAWKPSIVIGSPLWLEGEDLSAIQIADRKVAQTRLWADHYRVPYFVQAHQEAIKERQNLDETSEENTKPRLVSPLS